MLRGLFIDGLGKTIEQKIFGRRLVGGKLVVVERTLPQQLGRVAGEDAEQVELLRRNAGQLGGSAADVVGGHQRHVHRPAGQRAAVGRLRGFVVRLGRLRGGPVAAGAAGGGGRGRKGGDCGR